MWPTNILCCVCVGGGGGVDGVQVSVPAIYIVASSPGSPIFSNVARVKRGSLVSNVTYVTS